MIKSGFTMIEVVAVLVLIGIISAVTVSTLPKVGESEFSERLLLKSNLRYARQRSMDTEDNWSVSFGGNTYTLLRDGSPSGVFPALDAGTHTSAAPFAAPASIEFASPNGTLVGVDKTVAFANSAVTVYSTGAIQ